MLRAEQWLSLGWPGCTAFDAALNSGFHLAYVVGAGLVAVALAIAIFVLRSEPAPEHGEAATAEEAQRAGEPAYSEAG